MEAWLWKPGSGSLVVEAWLWKLVAGGMRYTRLRSVPDRTEPTSHASMNGGLGKPTHGSVASVNGMTWAYSGARRNEHHKQDESGAHTEGTVARRV